jgi:uncharacterized protein YceK
MAIPYGACSRILVQPYRSIARLDLPYEEGRTKLAGPLPWSRAQGEGCCSYLEIPDSMLIDELFTPIAYRPRGSEDEF